MLTIAPIPFDSPQLDTALDALANGKRRGIVHELALRPTTVGELAKMQGLSLPAIHRHIRVLETAELIIRKKSGRTNYVVLNAKTLHLVQQWLLQYKTVWSNDQATLENYISRMKQ